MAVYLVEEQLKRASSAVHWMNKSMGMNRYVVDGLEDLHRVSWNAYMRANRASKRLEELDGVRTGSSALARKGVIAEEKKLLGEIFHALREIWRNVNRFYVLADNDMDFEKAEPLPFPEHDN